MYEVMLLNDFFKNANLGDCPYCGTYNGYHHSATCPVVCWELVVNEYNL